MNIKEYKERKDALRRDIESLVREFNRDTETVVLSLGVDIDLNRQFGKDSPYMSGLICNITTEIDR